ncbi:hypothetical protein PAHAL_7G263800 [Panicum hallii]|uniref:Uncharacterized protein n=1 Tax=Panicum hallii TaxID=206008 RepID=A0A2T8IDM1_9POAL|nr:hypothetical protein PAHAL_7G263800 [Panicum hallii]
MSTKTVQVQTASPSCPTIQKIRRFTLLSTNVTHQTRTPQNSRITTTRCHCRNQN